MCMSGGYFSLITKSNKSEMVINVNAGACPRGSCHYYLFGHVFILCTHTHTHIQCSTVHYTCMYTQWQQAPSAHTYVDFTHKSQLHLTQNDMELYKQEHVNKPDTQYLINRVTCNLFWFVIILYTVMNIKDSLCTDFFFLQQSWRIWALQKISGK